MSIINQMLKDLQERQESVKQLPLQAITHPPRSILRPIALASLILLLSLIYWWWNHSQTESTSANQSIEQPFFAQEPDNNSDKSATKNKPEVIAADSDIKSGTNPVLNFKKETLASTQSFDKIESQPLINAQTKSANPQKTKTEFKPVTPSKLIPVVKQDTLLVAEKRLTETAKLPAPVEKALVTKKKQQIKQQSLTTQLNNRLEKIKQQHGFVGIVKTKSALKALLQENPDMHSARLYLIKLVWQERDNETPELINQAISLFPNQSAFRLAGARYYFEKQDYSKAEESLLNIQPSSSNISELLQMRAVIRQKLNKHQLAVEDYTSILRLDNRRGDIYIALGISLEALDLNSQALQSFQKARQDNSLSKRQVQFITGKIQQYAQINQG